MANSTIIKELTCTYKDYNTETLGDIDNDVKTYKAIMCSTSAAVTEILTKGEVTLVAIGFLYFNPRANSSEGVLVSTGGGQLVAFRFSANSVSNLKHVSLSAFS